MFTSLSRSLLGPLSNSGHTKLHVIWVVLRKIEFVTQALLSPEYKQVVHDF